MFSRRLEGPVLSASKDERYSILPRIAAPVEVSREPHVHWFTPVSASSGSLNGRTGRSPPETDLLWCGP